MDVCAETSRDSLDALRRCFNVATQDLRKMSPKRLTQFTLNVLRRTSVWFRTPKRLNPNRWLLLGEEVVSLAFKHKKDCFTCAVGAVLLADGETAACEWNIGNTDRWPDFTIDFLCGLSRAYERRGRTAAIKYAEKMAKGGYKEPEEVDVEWGSLDVK